MINPLAIAACLALGFGGLAFAFVGGDSRTDKRRAAVTKTEAKASVAAGVDRAARKKQIADGVRDSEMKGKSGGASVWRQKLNRPGSRSPNSNIGSGAYSLA
jgi:hypothetical protein